MESCGFIFGTSGKASEAEVTNKFFGGEKGKINEVQVLVRRPVDVHHP
jgi:hypothetical protein